MREYSFELGIKETPRLVLRASAAENIAQCTWSVQLSIPEHDWRSSEASWRLNMRPRGHFPKDLDLERQQEICELLGVTRSRLLVDVKTSSAAWLHYWGWTNAPQESFHALGVLGTRLKVVGDLLQHKNKRMAYPSDHIAAANLSEGLPDGWAPALGGVLVEMSQLLPVEC